MITLIIIGFIPLSARAYPVLNLKIFSNKNEYYMRESVNIYANLTETGTPLPNGLVGLQIDDATGTHLVIRTLNQSPSYNYQMEILELTPCDNHGTPKTSFKKGTLAYFNVTYKNNYVGTLYARIVINLYDRYMVPIGYSSISLQIGEGDVIEYRPSISIIAESHTGDAFVYANLYSDWPSLGGTPYCPEKSASFKITDGSPIDTRIVPAANIPPASYMSHQFAFRLSRNPKVGTYHVYATSQYGAGTVSANKIFEVKESFLVPPSPDFFWTPNKPYPGGTLTFDASWSTPNGPIDDYITSYWFDFGDGTNSTSTGQSGSIQYHSYTTAQTYDVTLNVTDNEGLWATTTKPVTVYPTYGPTANFTYSAAYANVTTTFNASSTTLGWNGTDNPPIIGYTWNFGDSPTNFTETDPIAAHVYNATGNYTVTLTVTDSAGKQGTISKNVTVTIAPITKDIAIILVTLSTTSAYNGTALSPGRVVDIDVIVRNSGTTKESFNVTVYYNTTLLETQTITDMYGLSEQTLTFHWNTTYVLASPSYVIKAEASIVENETNTDNNIYTDGSVKIKIQGDVDGDGLVYLKDLNLFGKAWRAKVGDSNYDPQCDFDGDGWIYLKDLNIFGKNWYKRAW